MIRTANDYYWTPLLADEADEGQAPDRRPTGEAPARYGTVALDMFGDAQWTQAEQVRVRSWHDVHAGPRRSTGN